MAGRPRSALLLVALMMTAVACSKAGDGAGRVGSFSASNMNPKQVAQRMAKHFKLHRNRPHFGGRIGPARTITNTKSGDPGVEVGLRFGEQTGDFKIYKLASEANRQKILSSYDRIERIQSARQGSPYRWCYLARRDLLLDCQMIPDDQQEAVQEQFLDALE